MNTLLQDLKFIWRQDRNFKVLGTSLSMYETCTKIRRYIIIKNPLCLDCTFVVFWLSVRHICLYIVGVPFSSLLSIGDEGFLRVFEEDIFTSCIMTHMLQHLFLSVTSQVERFWCCIVFSLPELRDVGYFPFSWEAFSCYLIDLLLIVTVGVSSQRKLCFVLVSKDVW